VKLVVFGLTLSSSWGNGHATPYRAILKALSRRGVDITFFEKDVEYYALRRDFSEIDYCRLVLYPSWDEVRSFALRECEDADVVMTASYVPDGARITDEVMGLQRPLRVFYDLDTPITLKGLREGTVDFLRASQIPAFDLYLSFTGGRILHELASEFGASLVKPLYGCVDPEVHARVVKRPEFACGLSYMGTYAADRQSLMDELFLEPARRLPAEQFVLAGSMYPWEWHWPANVRRYEHVSPGDHPALYSSSRMTLNITRKEMAASGYCPSGRFFEATACGTPIVTDYFEGLESFFDLHEQLMVADSTEHVVHALRRDDSDLWRLAMRARERTLAEHTGESRANELLKHFDEAWRRSSSAPTASLDGARRLGAAS
jgi:spore maturation protein CgeB